jgi:drug/metabolite transporter (DMT)-like permease
MAQAFRVAEATAVLPLDFMKLVWGAAIGYLLFAEVPDAGIWIGGTTIFAAATYIVYREGRQK